MMQRETIVEEVHRRLAGVSGVRRCVRDPEAPPGEGGLPAIHIFELNDEVTDSKGQLYPSHRSVLGLAIEVFIAGTSEGAAPKELMSFVEAVLKALYIDGASLGGLALLRMTGATRIVVVEGDHVRGIGLAFDIVYSEDIRAIATG